MKLPLQNAPQITDRSDLVPVRSNIHPAVYEHIFKQLCPLRGVQAQIISLVFDKLHSVILIDPSLDEFRIHKSNGDIAFFYDAGVLPALAAIVDRCDFRSRDSGPSRSSIDRNTVGSTPSREDDSRGNPSVCDAPSDPSHVGPDIESQVVSDEGVKRLAAAIFKG